MPFAVLALGAPMEIVGAMLSTLTVAEGPSAEALFPAKSEAVEPAIDIPTVPLPVKLLSVIVLVVGPLPVTVILAFAPPVGLMVTSPLANVTAFAPV